MILHNIHLLAGILICILLAGCANQTPTQPVIPVSVAADGKQATVALKPGSTVMEAIKAVNIGLGSNDRVEPPMYSKLAEGTTVKVIRVLEEERREQVAIPFEHQELKNEALPEGEKRLSQAGENGLEEITFRRVLEDGVEVSDSIVKRSIIKDAIPEVIMVGSKPTFSTFNIPGKIAYLSAGNAWIMETSTRNRFVVVSTGDLDGRIFRLSPDGRYLLFTRAADQADQVNSLWAANLKTNPIKLIDLGIENVVHYADFGASSSNVAYSTADWSEAAPGWQANNDLYEIELGEDGTVGEPIQVQAANSGGVYGWWGSQYAWSPDKTQFLVAQADQVGLIDETSGVSRELISIPPYQTGGDWAWVPGIAWSPDGQVIYTVTHVSPTEGNQADSQEFDLVGYPITGNAPIRLVKNTGMFAYPVVSPVIRQTSLYNDDLGSNVEQDTFYVAYLQANNPAESESSVYKLMTIDRDGSNQKSLFPVEESTGLEPQQVAWSPSGVGIDGSYAIAVIYNGNIWIVDAETGAAQQITGDGLASRLDWR